MFTTVEADWVDNVLLQQTVFKELLLGYNMKLAYVSDLHLEFGEIAPEDLIVDADYIALIGDIAEARNYTKSMNEKSSEYDYWYQRLYKLFERLSDHYKKVIVILGNHEYYKSRIGKAEEIIKKFCSLFPNVVMLQNETIDLDGYKVFGATLWTDMARNNPSEEYTIGTRMNDFRYITYATGGVYKKFKPFHAAALHGETLRKIEEEKPDIILQHHAPSELSIPEKFKGSSLNGAYASRVEPELIDRIKPKLIIHGHIHNPTDHMLYDTRVVSNPRGYVGMDAGMNGPYKAKVVEL